MPTETLVSNVSILVLEHLIQASQLGGHSVIHFEKPVREIAMQRLRTAFVALQNLPVTVGRSHHADDRHNAFESLRNVPATTIVGELKVFGNSAGHASDDGSNFRFLYEPNGNRSRERR